MVPQTREVSGFWRAGQRGKKDLCADRVRCERENTLCPRGAHCRRVPRVPRHSGRNSLISKGGDRLGKLYTGEERHTLRAEETPSVS